MNSLVSDRSVVQQLSAVSADLQQAAFGSVATQMSDAQQLSTSSSGVQQTWTLDNQRSTTQLSTVSTSSPQQQAELLSEHSVVQQSPDMFLSSRQTVPPVASLETQAASDSSNSSNYRFQSFAASSVTAQQQSTDIHSSYPILHSPQPPTDMLQQQPVAEAVTAEPVVTEQRQEVSVSSPAPVHTSETLASAIPPLPSFQPSAVSQYTTQPATAVMSPVTAQPFTHTSTDLFLQPQALSQPALPVVASVTREFLPVSPVQPSVSAYTAPAAIAPLPVAPMLIPAAQPTHSLAATPSSITPLVPAMPAVSSPQQSAQRAIFSSPVQPTSLGSVSSTIASADRSISALDVQLASIAPVPTQELPQTMLYEPPVVVTTAAAYQLQPQQQVAPVLALLPTMATLSAPSQPLFPRPIGAFSYTAPAAPVLAASQASYIPAPAVSAASRDAYIPAVAFSPARTRVSRDVPVDAERGHVRKSSFAANALEQWPAATSAATHSSSSEALEPQTASQLQSDSSLQQSSTAAAVVTNAMPMYTEGIQGPSAMQSRSVAVDAPTLVLPPNSSVTMLSGTLQSEVGAVTSTLMMQPQSASPMPGTVVGPGVTSSFIPPAPYTAAAPGAETSFALPPGYTMSSPRPVCEGHETNSDTWSVTDSVVSDPDAPVLAGQPDSVATSEPAKQSRLGRLLSRNKSSEPTAATAHIAAQAGMSW